MSLDNRLDSLAHWLEGDLIIEPNTQLAKTYYDKARIKIELRKVGHIIRLSCYDSL